MLAKFLKLQAFKLINHYLSRILYIFDGIFSNLKNIKMCKIIFLYPEFTLQTILQVRYLFTETNFATYCLRKQFGVVMYLRIINLHFWGKKNLKSRRNLTSRFEV